MPDYGSYGGPTPAQRRAKVQRVEAKLRAKGLTPNSGKWYTVRSRYMSNPNV